MTTTKSRKKRLARVKRGPLTKPQKYARECFGCGFAHGLDYPNCVWNKNPY